MADTKLGATKWAENRRDASLLNYSRRYGVDNVLGSIFPYQFWYTRSAMQWALRAIDKPSWLANWARIRHMQEHTVKMPGFPSRLVGKMRIPVPFLPAWAGGAVYVDPLHQLMPFEQIMRPWDTQLKNEQQQDKRAIYILQDWVGSEKTTEADAAQAAQTKSGPLWDKASAQAALELENDTTNPFDFATSMTGTSLPISWLSSIARGKTDKQSLLPVTRTIQSMTAWATPGGINIEAPIRKLLNLPVGGQLDDFYIDRMLANMAAEGANTDQIMQAMVDRTGPLFTQATDRVGKMQAIRSLGSALWLDFFPEGEQVQRADQLMFSKAIDSGDKTAVSKFFEDHPEYRARILMGKWDDPEGRLRSFLISDVWDAYRNTPALHQKQLRDQLGDTFNQAFLSKETRSYDAIDTATLTYWAKAMGGYMPNTAPATPQIAPALAPAEDTAIYQQYKDTRDKLFPGVTTLESMVYNLPADQQQAFRAKFPILDKYNAWRDEFLAHNPNIIQYTMGEDNTMQGAPVQVQQLVYGYRAERYRLFGSGIFETQTAYFDKPEGGPRRTFLTNHPELKAYWDWQYAFLAQYPNTIPYIKSVETIAAKVLGKNYNPANVMDFSQTNTAAGLPTTNTIKTADFPPALISQLMAYYINKQPLGSGALAQLRRIWEQNGKPGGSLSSYLSILQSSFTIR